MSTLRRAGMALVTITLAGVLGYGCSGSSQLATLPAERSAVVTRYVALGGDDNLGSRRTFADAWPQRLFRRALPRAAVFVNLADSRSGIVEILADQVDAAIALRPDIVTITVVDDAERETAPSDVERDLTEVLDRVGAARPKARILVGTIPPGTGSPQVANGLDQAIRRAATGRAVVVDLGSIGDSDLDLRNAAIARAFARALRPA